METRRAKAGGAPRLDPTDRSVTADEIMALRVAAGCDADTAETWRACIEQSLFVVTARADNNGELLGIGFLAGNARHAELVDMAVHPRAQYRGIGRRLQKERIDFAREHGIKFVGVAWDPHHPWLKNFYESNGFRQFDNIMWLEESIALARGQDSPAT